MAGGGDSAAAGTGGGELAAASSRQHSGRDGANWALACACAGGGDGDTAAGGGDRLAAGTGGGELAAATVAATGAGGGELAAAGVGGGLLAIGNCWLPTCTMLAAVTLTPEHTDCVRTGPEQKVCWEGSCWQASLNPAGGSTQAAQACDVGQSCATRSNKRALLEAGS